MFHFFIAFILLWRSDVLLKKYATVKACECLFEEISKWPSLLKTKSASTEKLITRAKWAQAVYPKRTVCLPRSMALYSLLVLYGADAKLCFGVRIDPPRVFHAWVEVDKQPVTDDKHRIFEYKPLLIFHSKEMSRFEKRIQL